MAKFGYQLDDWYRLEPERRGELIAHEYERRLREAHFNDHQYRKTRDAAKRNKPGAGGRTPDAMDQHWSDLGFGRGSASGSGQPS